MRAHRGLRQEEGIWITVGTRAFRISAIEGQKTGEAEPIGVTVADGDGGSGCGATYGITSS